MGMLKQLKRRISESMATSYPRYIVAHLLTVVLQVGCVLGCR